MQELLLFRKVHVSFDRSHRALQIAHQMPLFAPSQLRALFGKFHALLTARRKLLPFQAFGVAPAFVPQLSKTRFEFDDKNSPLRARACPLSLTSNLSASDEKCNAQRRQNLLKTSDSALAQTVSKSTSLPLHARSSCALVLSAQAQAMCERVRVMLFTE